MNPIRPQPGEHAEHDGIIYRPLTVGEIRKPGDVYFWDGNCRLEIFDETPQISCEMGIEQSYREIPEPNIEDSPTRNPIVS